MDVLIGSGVGSTAIAVGISPKNSFLVRSARLGSLFLRKPRFPANSMRIPRGAAAAARAVMAETAAIDLSDPDWRLKYQRDFEERFNIPHITDVFPDAEAIRSTFCLKMRSPTEDFSGGYPSDEEWHGYINNKDRVLLKVINYSSPTSAGAVCIDPDCTWIEQWVHRAGPREKIYFRPEKVKAAIVTCGGLCPGLNDVIRHIVITLEIYGVKNVVGIPFGYRGFSDKNLPEIPLSRKVVQNIHLSGGSLLGVSRGGPAVSEIVDSMEERGINMLFVLGGNGTHAGANAIHNECRKRRMKVAVVGVPKTIDNDILHMDKTFGFDTAVEEAQRAINSAYIEAHSAYHGIGVVKLMGRSSGFIAMQASLASGQVDICLIPEVPFNLHGPHGVLKHLKYLIETKGSAVICVAEGAGQSFLENTNAKDASGNKTKKYFKEIGTSADVKYIDPTYMIRAVRANASDGILCTVLGQNAVHGAFAGYSGITVGIINTHYAYLPIPEVIAYAKSVDPNSRMWHRCLTSTGQPDFV
ncbi:ATP-dependent 6-phosphofructokinase 5, chloroplastic isoform X2 [Eutrema salsugineum]|uniref:ATP-dependent 6-phosphofructokinase 5, chloroplastic isoform X2 n=1 Tax=Eutrema salsugineum TaxID=72664 RepID=UPI000CED7C87|nr:ATP-dependent 6-phosphofructokinase 5, chloroplastic isoform X2 [Eutrema salsugineum]